jgi:uncharacterized protein YegL
MADQRRLPVYLLIDTSGSMSGEPMEACRAGLKALLSDLRSDPQALETAQLSVITFGSSAQQTCPLTELVEFQEPRLEAMGSTAMGAALSLLASSVARDVRQSTPEQKGDWKPLVFLLTDGQPTDRWEDAAARVKEQRLNIIACAAGPGADVQLLRKITENVIVLAGMEPEQLKAFFKWVSSSVKATSHKAMSPGSPVQLPPTPGGFTIVP